MSTGVWYHVGATFNNSSKAFQLSIYEDGVGVIHDHSGTATDNISITSGGFAIGATFDSGTPYRHFDGWIDEVVVFSDILTPGEIDQIRSGTYSGPVPTTTTLFPPTTTTTTTTTLPGPTTTTLPPVPGDNDFSGDGNAVALRRVDNGTLTTDHTGNGNTLTDNGGVG